MLSRLEIEKIFTLIDHQPKFIDFKPAIGIINNRAIKNREIATKKSFGNQSLDLIAEQEGSPSFEIINSLIKTLEEAKIIPKLSGIGVEMGSGLGLLSAALINQDESDSITGILAVEAGLPFVEEGIRRASKIVLGNKAFKIMPCYGSFDAIAIESNSIDFVIQIESLHHADNLLPPLVESYRILKNGGYVMSIDRSWPNKVDRKVLVELLDHEYSKEWLDLKGFPSNEAFSRRDNGEHEYLDLDWENSFKQAGFRCIAIRHLHPKISVKQLIKRFVCFFKLNHMCKIKIPSRSGVFRGFLQANLCLNIFGKKTIVVVKHPRPLTVSVWQKQLT